MFRERAKTLQAASLFLDVLCISVGFGLALLLRAFHDRIPLIGNLPALPWSAETVGRSDYAVLLGTSMVAWVVSLRNSGVYLSHRSERYTAILLHYLRALCLAGLATGAATFVLKMGGISRIFFGYYFACAFALLLGKQSFVIYVLRRLRKSGYNQRHALVLGAGRPASWFAKVLMDSRETGYHLVGLLLTRKLISPETPGVPVIGTIDELDRALAENPVDEVFVVGGAAEIAELAPVAQTLIERGRVVSLITPMVGGEHGVRGRVTEFSGVPMISFGPRPHDEVEAGFKRALDVAVAAAALAVASPVMMVVAAAIKLLDPGPALFSQERLGRGGRPFRLYKFRSMRVDAENVLRSRPELHRRYVENDYKLPEADDPRILPLGRFLRRTSLDELPQLWNVLKGDMAIVGPRPIVPAEIEKYEPYGDLFLSSRPGLTGQWQVHGRSEVQYPERAYMDLDYIAGRSVLTDLDILVRTVPAVIRRTGAH
jgi:exopolysaccharide biosynthesis polyprenyl glycosylphosphotransferase